MQSVNEVFTSEIIYIDTIQGFLCARDPHVSVVSIRVNQLDFAIQFLTICCSTDPLWFVGSIWFDTCLDISTFEKNMNA